MSDIKAKPIPVKDANWPDAICCALTIADKEGIVVYQNERSLATFGDKTGESMIPCHSERSQALIHHMLATGDTNVYTIRKNGIRKLIYQTPWRRDGEIAGLAEFSIPLPDDLPHYER